MAKFKRASDIKVGVVGYGPTFNMGRQHLKEMQGAGMTPTAVADADPSRLEVAAADWPGIQTYPSPAAMLRKSGVDLVTIITPHNTHTKLATQALKAGRHVVVEKPLAITTAQCDGMIAAAKKAGVVLSTYHNRHWDGSILRALKTIRANTIGEVVRIEAHFGGWEKPRDWWRSSRSISGGILFDWGVHLLEYSLQIIQSDAIEVAGFASSGYWGPKIKWKADASEDEGFAVVRFASGQWLTLCVSSIDSDSKYPERGMIEITGTKGTYVMGYSTWALHTQRDGQTVVTKGANPPAEGWRYYKNVADHLVSGERLVITPQWARRPIHILDLAVQSAAQGKALRTKYK
ncbi:MAG TPA: Gfo/Idh/MocA family oxidoreductase [Phycisphaerae bacterium]|nr:Gfo/Idh/MocA family oxidoreductase [Phycisphaerae bacterium]